MLICPTKLWYEKVPTVLTNKQSTGQQVIPIVGVITAFCLQKQDYLSFAKIHVKKLKIGVLIEE